MKKIILLIFFTSYIFANTSLKDSNKVVIHYHGLHENSVLFQKFITEYSNFVLSNYKKKEYNTWFRSYWLETKEPYAIPGYTDYIYKTARKYNDYKSTSSFYSSIAKEYIYKGKVLKYLERDFSGSDKIFLVMSHSLDIEFEHLELEKLSSELKSNNVILVTMEDTSYKLKDKYKILAQKIGLFSCHITDKESMNNCFKMKNIKKKDKYKYSQVSKKCRNSKLQFGLNKFDINEYNKNPKSLECMDFRGVDFTKYPYSSIDMKYDTVSDGSTFDNSIVRFLSGSFKGTSFINTKFITENKNAIFSDSTISMNPKSNAVFWKSAFINGTKFPSGLIAKEVGLFSSVLKDIDIKGVDIYLGFVRNTVFQDTNIENSNIEFKKESSLKILGKSYLNNVEFKNSHFNKFEYDVPYFDSIVSFKYTDVDNLIFKEGTYLKKLSIDRMIKSNIIMLDKSNVDNLNVISSDVTFDLKNKANIKELITSRNLKINFNLYSSYIRFHDTNDDKIVYNLKKISLIKKITGSNSQIDLSLHNSGVYNANLSKMDNNFGFNSIGSLVSNSSFKSLKDNEFNNIIINSKFNNVDFDYFSFSGKIKDSEFLNSYNIENSNIK